MLDIYNNKIAFMKETPQSLYPTIYFLILILGIFIYAISKTKIYDNYQTKGYITCSNTCQLTVLYPSNINYNEIYFNNKKLLYDVLDEQIVLDEENLISYKKLILLFKENIFQDKEIIKVNFYYNKQRIITKIIKMAF